MSGRRKGWKASETDLQLAAAVTVRRFEGTMAHTQDLVRKLTEDVAALARRIANPEADRTYWFVARISKGAFQLASWHGRRVRWIADPMVATGYQAHSGAHTAIKGLPQRKGLTYTILRIVL
jgi:hypothetical protein